MEEQNKAEATHFVGEERHKLALVQVWEIHETMVDREHGIIPEHDFHILSRFNPIQHPLEIMRQLLHCVDLLLLPYSCPVSHQVSHPYAGLEWAGEVVCLESTLTISQAY